LIRAAREEDVRRMVELSEAKRRQYQAYQPVFWRKAADAVERQYPFLARLVEKGEAIALVAEDEGGVVGFVVATLVAAPPVYDPGGLTCMIDDFVVARAADWETAGKRLLEEAGRQARERGAVQAVVVCGHQDEAKRQMLAALGFEIASEWHVRPL
jgi:GNAT superfamily N-acetyltransferase